MKSIIYYEDWDDFGSFSIPKLSLRSTKMWASFFSALQNLEIRRILSKCLRNLKFERVPVLSGPINWVKLGLFYLTGILNSFQN